MASVNITHIIGNVGKDPEIKYLPNGDAVANFSVATSESWKTKDGEKKEVTQWHRIVCYRKLAEIVESYVRTGSSVYIEGKIVNSDYTDKEGIKRYSTQIEANALRMLDKKGKNSASVKEESKSNGYQSQSDDPMDFEDSIPF